MSPQAAALEPYLSRWTLRDPVHVATTPRAWVWRVSTGDGEVAALKIARGPIKASEAGATAILHAVDGRGAVRCLQSDARAWLLEWADGPSLGDIARGGEDARATAILASVAAELHACPLPADPSLPDLRTWCAALTRHDPALAPDADGRRRIATAQALLTDLLSSPGDLRSLHGDLHHDNVRLSGRGWLAFDPKGIRGELAYETANAFRNPVGMAEATRHPARIAALADAFAAALPVDRTRMLRWAAVKCALSISWGLEDAKGPGADWQLLGQLLDAAGA